MIKFQNEDKTLVVPSSLGNFPSNAGGGSDVTRQDVINIVDSAITEYDTEIQVDLEEIRENVSGNTEDIAAHGAALADIRSDVDALSGTARDIRWDVDSISARTSNNTADIAALSGATEGIEGTVRSVVSNVETLSGVVETNALGIQNLDNYTQNELAPAIGGIGQDLGALSGQVETLSSSTVTGLETAQNAANSADTKASSAYTLADSAYTRADAAYTLAESLTGATGGPEVVILNKLSEQERLALYATINSYYDQSTASFTTAWTEDLYAFYIDLRTHADQEDYGTNDKYEGFFPMQVNRVHPSDYGGAVFFSGVEASREGNGILINIRYVITADGQFDKGTWWNTTSSDPTMQFNLRINSDGTIANDQDWSPIADSNNAGRVVMQYYEGTQYGDIYSEGKVKWVNMYPTTYNNETKWYWIWAADICVGTTMYSGVWGMIQDQWYSGSDVPPQVLQWTSGATYESQTYPPIS